MTPFVEQAIPPHALLQRSPILKPASSSNEKRALGEKVLSEIHTFEKRGGFGIVTWRMIGKYKGLIDDLTSSRPGVVSRGLEQLDSLPLDVMHKIVEKVLLAKDGVKVMAPPNPLPAQPEATIMVYSLTRWGYCIGEVVLSPEMATHTLKVLKSELHFKQDQGKGILSFTHKWIVSQPDFAFSEWPLENGGAVKNKPKGRRLPIWSLWAAGIMAGGILAVRLIKLAGVILRAESNGQAPDPVQNAYSPASPQKLARAA